MAEASLMWMELLFLMEVSTGGFSIHRCFVKKRD